MSKQKKRMSKQKKDRRSTCGRCEVCDECIALGDGDFMCDIKNVLVINAYTPTDSYSLCEKGGAENE